MAARLPGRPYAETLHPYQQIKIINWYLRVAEPGLLRWEMLFAQ